jgi:acyl-CoA synthetase (NDP forming)
MRQDLSRLLAPRSVAVFGGSWAERVVEQCQKIGFAGEIWPVHPTKGEVRGLKCYRSVDELPGAPDASFVAVNRNLAVEAMRDLADKDAGGAVCFAAGFKEAGPEGAKLQDELVAAAGDMPFLGPNCYGLINYVDGALLWPDQHGGERTERGVAILMQSGNIALNMTMVRRGMPIAYLAALGNQAKVGLSDMIAALAKTGRVTAIGLLIEGIDDISMFAAAVAEARALGVPVVALKAGRTTSGAALAMSHTGSLAGSDTVMDAYLKKLGVARVTSLTVLIETLKLLHVHGPLPGRDIVSLSCSGGEALMMSDAGEGRAINFRPFTIDDIARIRPTTNPLVTISNPLDYHTFDWGKFDRLEATFTQVLKSRFDLGFIVMDIPREDRCRGEEWKAGIDAFVAAGKQAGARTGVLSTLVECMPEAYAKELIARGVAPMMGMEDCLSAIEAASFLGERRELWQPLPVPALTSAGARALDEWTAKQKLAEFGLATPRARLVHDSDEAVSAAAAIGYPVVAKIVSETILHKTEAGGVRLNLKSAGDVRDAIAGMAKLSDRFLVEAMVTDTVAELIVGVTRDPQLGPVVVVGAGGILVELLAETRTLLLPTSEAEIEAAIRSLRVFKLIDGFRGRPKGDLSAAVQAVAAVARFAQTHAATLVELDVNPLMIRPEGKGAMAADALIRLAI